MSEQQENPPNKETETATSAEESREEHPETPPPQQSEEQPSEEKEKEAEKEEEEEENKNAVTEEKRPHESAGEDDDSDSQRQGKKLKESVDGDEDKEEEDRNPRNVASDPVNGLDPFLERLERDPETQMGFLTGMEHYHQRNNVYPFETDAAMGDFVANWLQVEVTRMELHLALIRMWRRYTTVGANIGENLNYLNPSSRQVFLLMNRILYAYYKAADDNEKKMELQTTPPTSPTKSITIGGRRNAPPPQEKPLKKYVLVNTRRKLCLESQLKLKQKKPEYLEKEKERRRWYPEKRQREDPYEEEKPREESPRAEKPSEKEEEEEKPPPVEKPSEDPEEEAAWSDENFETLNSILQGVIDYNYTLSRYPYEDVSDMDDFIKNWVGLHLSVSDCLEIIERLKRNYKKNFWRGIDHGLKFMSHKQELLYSASDVIWNMEAHLGSDEEEEEVAAEVAEEDAEERRSANEGGETVEWMPSDIRDHLDYFDAEYKRPEMRALMPHLFQKTIERGIETMRDAVVPVDKPSGGPVNLWKIKRRRRVRVQPPAVPKFQINQKDRVLPPVPKFHSTDGEDSMKQKVRLLPPVPKFCSTAGKDDENQKDRVLPPVPKFHSSDGEDGKKLRFRFLPPKFHSTAGEDNEEQKGGTGEGSSVKRDDPGGPSGQSGDDDPEKPHDQNPGNEEAPAKTDEDCSMKKNDPGGSSGESGDDPEKSHDENLESGAGDEDRSMNKNDPGVPSGQSDADPEKPHDENPGNEEADGSKSSGGEE